jgi:aerobic carbon-monoxide dehydrogenase medium subunit
MSALRPFALYQPTTLADAAGVLASEGTEAALYAGGTELLIMLKEGLIRPRSLVDLKRIPGLADIANDDGHLTIGATATHRSVEAATAIRTRCALIGRVARHVANIRVRSVGTVGGNLAFADPHSDLATVFLTFDAVVRLVSPKATRELPLADFVLGSYETARGDDEILAAVRLTPWPANTVGAYAKFGMHERPTLGVAAALTPAGDTVGELRIAVGCVGPRPQRSRAAEERARGAPLTELAKHVDEIAALAARDVRPMTDQHGSADYKRDMTRVFVRRAVLAAAVRATGREPHERYPHTVIV